jgi:hypothetical protein
MMRFSEKEKYYDLCPCKGTEYPGPETAKAAWLEGKKFLAMGGGMACRSDELLKKLATAEYTAVRVFGGHRFTVVEVLA